MTLGVSCWGGFGGHGYAVVLERAADGSMDPQTPGMPAPTVGARSVIMKDLRRPRLSNKPTDATLQNRVHLDFDSDDIAGEVARVIALGAAHIYDKAE